MIFLKSRHYKDNIDQPTATCICQAEYSTPSKRWEVIHNEKEIDEDLIEVNSDIWYRPIVPQYGSAGESFDYSDERFKTGQNEYIFNYAHSNNVCSCASSYKDFTFGTAEYEMFFKNKSLEYTIGNYGSFGCWKDNMEDFECYYYTRDFDNFDLWIESAKKDGCVQCYGVGSNLWPLPEHELINTLTRFEGDNDYCTPKHGYHKSRKNEIYRCEEGNGATGVIAFTEANGNTDYECGYTIPTYAAFRAPDAREIMEKRRPILLVSLFTAIISFEFSIKLRMISNH